MLIVYAGLVSFLAVGISQYLQWILQYRSLEQTVESISHLTEEAILEIVIMFPHLIIIFNGLDLYQWYYTNA